MTDTITSRVWMGRYWLALGVCLLAGRFYCCPAAEAPAKPVDFSRDIRPILADACFHCHGPDQARRKARLRLDTEAGAFGELGGHRALVAGDLARSELYQRITAREPGERMPPARSGRTLSARQIDLLRRWIEQGAHWQKHWAFVAPARPLVPAVKDRAWVRNPIDVFIRQRLDQEGLVANPEADRPTLIRRLTLDLTGLPPTPAEVDAFVADPSPNAYDRVVDRLLASPRYGERMVLEWLDAARYADSNGYQADGTRTMWPWREWVIEALNANMPFDQFTVEQLAGDLLPNSTQEQKIATGFNRNHMLNGEGGRIAEESRVDYVVDRVDTTATIWLGLTFGCARCHDHKFDPFTQKEYYQVFAYFNNVTESGAVDRAGNASPVLSLPTSEQALQIADWNRTIRDLEKQLQANDQRLLAAQGDWEQRARADLAHQPSGIAEILKVAGPVRSDKQKQALADHYLAAFPERKELEKKLVEARKGLDKANRSVTLAMIMEERQQARETFVLQRGVYTKPGDRVGPGVPASLASLPSGAPGNRLGFARWVVDPGNPLTARVTVNRYWQQFFGTGLVKTAEDFGLQGEAPTHPALLDWLATEFMQTGWNVKHLHRLLVTSATYRQSSRTTPDLRERDPDNRWLARGPRFRLSSLVLRDQALAISGLLREKLGGPSVKPYQPAGIWEEMSFGHIQYQPDKGEGLYRRSLYTFWRRTVGPTSMFDTSARQVCTVRQGRTNTPLQSLILMNDVTYVEAARVLAERLLTEGGATLDERIGSVFRLATARPPRPAERAILTASFRRLLNLYRTDRDAALKLVAVGESARRPGLDPGELAAYTALANLVLNLDEVISKE